MDGAEKSIAMKWNAGAHTRYDAKKRLDVLEKSLERASEMFVVWNEEASNCRENISKKYDIVSTEQRRWKKSKHEQELLQMGFKLMEERERKKQDGENGMFVRDGDVSTFSGMHVVLAEEFGEWEGFRRFRGKVGVLVRRHIAGMWTAKFEGEDEYPFLCGPVLFQLKRHDQGTAPAGRKESEGGIVDDEADERLRRVLEEVKYKQVMVDALQEEMQTCGEELAQALRETRDNDSWWTSFRTPLEAKVARAEEEVEEAKGKIQKLQLQLDGKRRQLEQAEGDLEKSRKEAEDLHKIIQRTALRLTQTPEEAEVTRREAERKGTAILERMVFDYVAGGQFELWADHAQNAKRLRRILKRVAERWMGRGSAELLGMWSDCAKGRRKLRRMQENFAREWRMMYVEDAFGRWRRSLEARKSEEYAKKAREHFKSIQEAQENIRLEFSAKLLESERACRRMEGQLAANKGEIESLLAMKRVQMKFIEVLKEEKRSVEQKVEAMEDKMESLSASDSKWKGMHEKLWGRFMLLQKETKRLQPMEEELKAAKQDIEMFCRDLVRMKGDLVQMGRKQEKMEEQVVEMTRTLDASRRKGELRRRLLVRREEAAEKMHPTLLVMLVRWSGWSFRRRFVRQVKEFARRKKMRQEVQVCFRKMEINAEDRLKRRVVMLAVEKFQTRHEDRFRREMLRKFLATCLGRRCRARWLNNTVVNLQVRRNAGMRRQHVSLWLEIVREARVELNRSRLCLQHCKRRDKERLLVFCFRWCRLSAREEIGRRESRLEEVTSRLDEHELKIATLSAKLLASERKVKMAEERQREEEQAWQEIRSRCEDAESENVSTREKLAASRRLVDELQRVILSREREIEGLRRNAADVAEAESTSRNEDDEDAAEKDEQEGGDVDDQNPLKRSADHQESQEVQRTDIPGHLTLPTRDIRTHHLLHIATRLREEQQVNVQRWNPGQQEEESSQPEGHEHDEQGKADQRLNLSTLKKDVEEISNDRNANPRQAQVRSSSPQIQHHLSSAAIFSSSSSSTARKPRDHPRLARPRSALVTAVDTDRLLRRSSDLLDKHGHGAGKMISSKLKDPRQRTLVFPLYTNKEGDDTSLSSQSSLHNQAWRTLQGRDKSNKKTILPLYFTLQGERQE
uniref:Sfi1 spindle body domain-containing protein n=1 Tax=Hanusia phi TaxID=3032 RepID=A0A7S0HHW2_9CRYP|mmetsp:Transcript_2240/g.5194  ORF Transcript_2240/g.5194 Transcript_2240/m.5194 type:complete len:1138 (+) Transcript_2240:47-3460(+)